MRPWNNDHLRELVPEDGMLDRVLGSLALPRELSLRLVEKARDYEAETLEWSTSAPVLYERQFDEDKVLAVLGTPTCMTGGYECIEAFGSTGQCWVAEQYDWWCREVDESVPGKTYIRWSFGLMLVPHSRLDSVLRGVP